MVLPRTSYLLASALAMWTQVVTPEIFTDRRRGTLSFTCPSFYGLLHQNIQFSAQGKVNERGSPEISVTVTQLELFVNPQTLVVPRPGPNERSDVSFGFTARFCPGRGAQVRKDQLCHVRADFSASYFISEVENGPFRSNTFRGGIGGTTPAVTIRSYCIATTDAQCVAPGAVIATNPCQLQNRFTLGTF
ncbi:hypothetical protein CTRI78_v001866 [Colletotrichum trifolii]|uniref:Uncharacterized protein n=1 Tax=Colletotrichum trifolii TaxID=5466 RepID=A0A4R8RNZ6_COLTR|nr:hypothetical protein CTRI78_v001866 [Colletotrichum trifolii]